jgi:hypothetical protein
MRPYTDGPVEIHPETPKPDYVQVAKERMMTRTLTIREPDASKQLPEFLRPGWVPPHVWESLYYRTSEDRRTIQAVSGDEVYATISFEEAQDETRNLGNLLATRIQRHYLMKVKPELLCC